MKDNKLQAYKLTLLTPEEGTVLTNQSVVFSGEPTYIIAWKGRSYKRVTVSERPDGLPHLVYAEVTTCDLTSIALLSGGLERHY
jgi:hypothetical protein